MSGLGHFAPGFAAKSIPIKAPLWVLLAAGETNDILYTLFSSVGLEPKASFRISLTEGVQYLEKVSNPWSHGLFMSIIWSVAATGIAYLYYRDRRTAGVIGLVVLSHWGLDFLMHANLPLIFDGSPLVGLGLENSGPGFIFMTALDLVLFVVGISTYLVSKKKSKQ